MLLQDVKSVGILRGGFGSILIFSVPSSLLDEIGYQAAGTLDGDGFSCGDDVDMILFVVFDKATVLYGLSKLDKLPSLDVNVIGSIDRSVDSCVDLLGCHVVMRRLLEVPRIVFLGINFLG